MTVNYRRYNMENITGRAIRVKKYSREESKEALQKYAIDIVSGAGSELKDIDVLEYITCLSEDDRRTFKNLEKKMRNRLIGELENIFTDRYNGYGSLVNYDIKMGIVSSLENMTSAELLKIAPTFEKVGADFIANAIMESLKKSLES